MKIPWLPPDHVLGFAALRCPRPTAIRRVERRKRVLRTKWPTGTRLVLGTTCWAPVVILARRSVEIRILLRLVFQGDCGAEATALRLSRTFRVPARVEQDSTSGCDEAARAAFGVGACQRVPGERVPKPGCSLPRFICRPATSICEERSCGACQQLHVQRRRFLSGRAPPGVASSMHHRHVAAVTADACTARQPLSSAQTVTHLNALRIRSGPLVTAVLRSTDSKRTSFSPRGTETRRHRIVVGAENPSTTASTVAPPNKHVPSKTAITPSCRSR